MFILLLIVGLAAVTADPYHAQRIIGGAVTDIALYPFGASLLFTFNGITYVQSCGGSILNYRSILSATHCFIYSAPYYWRTRVGSTNANSGGVVHLTQTISTHPNYDKITYDNDIAVLRVSTNFVFNNLVKPGTFAGAHYNLQDNEAVWAIGWGYTVAGIHSTSEALRHVKVWVVNQAICRTRYAEIGNVVTDNMLCTGWLDVGGRDQCSGDSGGPLLHNNVVVGICSWGEKCALPRYPGVNVRVSRYSDFIRSNA